MSFLHRHKFIFGIIITVGVLLYAGFNVWVYRYARKGRGVDVFKGDSLPKQGVTFTDSNAAPVIPVSTTPTPRLTGPGSYACDPYGVCNKYSEEAQKQFCSVTYADFRCLDQCGDKEKQCTK